MANIKIYGHKAFLVPHKEVLSEAIHKAVVVALQYPLDKKFHRFLPLDEGFFIHPADRSEKYLDIEIHMFEGRTEATKRALIEQLFIELEHIGVTRQDVEVILIETPKVNWGIRGKNGADLALNYKVEV
ncbi:tautomerase family protein [Deinococcus roseus]|uniref:Tautomerase n=1 Tax=Deinococcus roseus TaxID=392414 RepID=A0ABQ2CZI3_9DEIO|nr:tautomerase family protein [Deinococcus roseus]GGJ25203.1 tautomerase [Deinococcus roseus]